MSQNWEVSETGQSCRGSAGVIKFGTKSELKSGRATERERIELKNWNSMSWPGFTRKSEERGKRKIKLTCRERSREDYRHMIGVWVRVGGGGGAKGGLESIKVEVVSRNFTFLFLHVHRQKSYRQLTRLALASEGLHPLHPPPPTHTWGVSVSPVRSSVCQ